MEFRKGASTTSLGNQVFIFTMSGQWRVVLSSHQNSMHPAHLHTAVRYSCTETACYAFDREKVELMDKQMDREMKNTFNSSS